MRRPPSSVPAVTRSKLVPLRRTSVLIFAQTAIRSLPEDRSWSTPADALSASTNVSTSPSNKRNRPFFRIFQENGLFFTHRYFPPVLHTAFYGIKQPIIHYRPTLSHITDSPADCCVFSILFVAANAV